MTVQATGHTWDVYVTPAGPTVTDDLPPGETQRLWSPASATLISGKRDAVLVDPGQFSGVAGDAVQHRGDPGQVGGDVSGAWPVVAGAQVHRRRVPAGVQAGEPARGLSERRATRADTW